MKRLVRPLLALSLLAGSHALQAQNKGLTSAIFTTLSGSAVNANQ